jgi:hypothetical protein
MPRTTVNIDETLLRKLKATAAQRGVTLAALVNQLLRRALASQGKKVPYEFKFGGWVSQLQPGVDLSNRDSLWDLMDGL